MKTHNILSVIAGLFAITGMTHAAIITNIHQDFEGYSPGALPITNGWSKSGGMTVDIVTNPVYAGTKAMQIERIASGSVSYMTASSPNIQLNLEANSEYQWSFAFRFDSDSTANPSGYIINLDSGSSANPFAALRLTYSSGALNALYYSNLGESYSSATNYTTLGSLSADTWYVASFDILTDASLNISQSISILSGTNVLYSGSVASQASLATTNAARMCWSPAPNGTIMQFDDLYLATIPEPSTLALTGFFGAVALLFARRHRQRRSK